LPVHCVTRGRVRHCRACVLSTNPPPHHHHHHHHHACVPTPRRYRANSSAAGLTGRRANMRILQERMPVTAAFAAASVFNIIARSPFVVHLVTSLQHGDYYRPGVVVPQPTLLVWGTEDDVHRAWAHPTRDTVHRTATLADAERLMLADLPQGQGVWVEGASHALVVDAMATCADLIATWLGGAEGEGGAAGDDEGAMPIALGVKAMRVLAAALHSTRGTARMQAAAPSAADKEPAPVPARL
jgi:hypothetical protein